MLHTSIKSNDYSNQTAIMGVAKYILGEHNRCHLSGATGLPYGSLTDMVNSMHDEKREFGKTTGRQLLHLVVSFDANDSKLLTPQMVLELGYQFAKQMIGCQTIFGVHDNTDHLHLHYVINSVNYASGNKNSFSYQEVYCHYNPLFNEILYRYKKERFGIDPYHCNSIDDLY